MKQGCFENKPLFPSTPLHKHRELRIQTFLFFTMLPPFLEEKVRSSQDMQCCVYCYHTH